MKRFAQQIGLLLLMLVLGTAIDRYVHSLRMEWYVEQSYFVNKILYGVVWGWIGWYTLRRVLAVSRPGVMALEVPAIISVVLQTKYFYQGRSLNFVILFLFLHYLMFLPPAFLVFGRFSDIFELNKPAPTRRRWGLFLMLALGLEVLFYLYFRLFPPFF